MASIDKIKGRFLYGGSQAASIPNLAGAGSLTYTAGAGGVVYHDNYVELKQGSFFTNPYTSTPRDRVKIIVGLIPFYDEVYDDDTVYRFPPTVAHAQVMTFSGALMTWAGVGYLQATGQQALFKGDTGSPSMTIGPYERLHQGTAYRDGTFSFLPQIFVLKHGADNTQCAVGLTAGRKMSWTTTATAYTGSAAAAAADKIGHLTNAGLAGVQANSHAILLGHADYTDLTKAECIEAVTEMVVLLEARGWTGIFHNPMTSE